METVRDIQLKIRMVGGHEHVAILPEDAPELRALFTALANPGAGSQFVQLPLDGGRVACSFQTEQVVAIVSEPPVVLKLEPPPAPLMPERSPEPPAFEPHASAFGIRRPRFMIIDDFLSQKEHDELLAFALVSEPNFQAGTVTPYDPDVRQNLVMLDFGESAHSKLIENRLLVWFPLIAKSLGVPVFPLAPFESQLTAAGDGYYFKVHCDSGPDLPRVLSCVYYLHREPRGFAGGDLRLYDCIESRDRRAAADTFTAIAPRANRLVVFSSSEFHEAMPVRCPSRNFADSRFAVTAWLHRSAHPRVDATYGWGHFRLGVVPTVFAAPDGNGP